MTKTEIKAIQEKLIALGFLKDQWGADGVWGPNTEKAYQRFQDEKTRILESKYTFNEEEEIPNVVPPAAIPWWTSKALIGGLMTIVASLAGLAGYAFDAGQATELAVSVITVITGLLAFIGTVKRKAPIDSTLVAPKVRVQNGKLVKEVKNPEEDNPWMENF